MFIIKISTNISHYVVVLIDVQVLSESVSKAIRLTGGDEAIETAHFVGMMDKFFDAMNVHNYIHGIHARKPFQMPYRSSEDMRLKVAKCRYDIIKNDFILITIIMVL